MTTIIGAISASHVIKRKQQPHPLTPATPSILSSVSFVTVERGGVCENTLLQQDPLQPVAIRRCLLESARDAGERAEIELMDIPQGLTNFRVGDLHVKTRKAMMMTRGKDAVDTWCSWQEEGPTKTTTFRFWTSPPSIDLSDFIVALCANTAKESTVHYEASVMPSEQGSWTKGVIDQGDASPKTGFYRVSQRVGGSVQADCNPP